MTWGTDPISQLQKQRLMEARQRAAAGLDPALTPDSDEDTPTGDGPVGLLIQALEQMTGKTVRLEDKDAS